MKKKVLVAGVLSAVTVAAGAFGIFNMLDVSSTKANFQKTANVTSEVAAGKLEFAVTKLEDLDAANALAAYDGSDITLGDVVGNTTNGMVIDDQGTYANNGIVSYMEDFSNIYPGWKTVYGFEVKNTGTLDEYLNIYLGTSHVGGTTTAITWDEQDPRSRIKYTIYRSSTMKGEYTAVATDTLDHAGQNIQIPTKVEHTGVKLKADPAETSYYIIALEFTEQTGLYSGLAVNANVNTSGDNVYQNSKIKLNLTIGTTGPGADNYEVPTGTN